MKKAIRALPSETAEVLEAGVFLGQNQSFGALAGRCSAAQAEALRRLKDGKSYQQLEPQWRDFCAKYLNMSGAQADRLIGLLEEFGPGYFELAQLTRVSPETFRAIAPALKDGALHHNGEVIEIGSGNAQKVAAAVKQLRAEFTPPPKKPLEKEETLPAIQAAPPPPPPPPPAPPRLDVRGWAVLNELRNLSREGCPPHDFAWFQKLVMGMLDISAQIYRDHGMR